MREKLREKLWEEIGDIDRNDPRLERIVDEILKEFTDVGWVETKNCPYCNSPIEVIKQCSIHCLEGF